MDIKHLKHPYHIINLTFAGIFLLIFIYSGIFSAEKNNYPIKSACKRITGKPCKSTGLSRSFSEIVRFNFQRAQKYNKYAIKIFSFFLIELLLRFFISFLIDKRPTQIKSIIFFDALFSVILYVYCFWGLIF